MELDQHAANQRCVHPVLPLWLPSLPRDRAAAYRCAIRAGGPGDAVGSAGRTNARPRLTGLPRAHTMMASGCPRPKVVGRVCGSKQPLATQIKATHHPSTVHRRSPSPPRPLPLPRPPPPPPPRPPPPPPPLPSRFCRPDGARLSRHVDTPRRAAHRRATPRAAGALFLL